ncbi:hypothetical protein BS47DRAFT_848767 [Hydnum rufescens UP504]|uniref:Uncharacterized protein n=1 Tax=Hydnum rufescens UP504 TaxID=1448309 RepID=A0A9P6E2F4_9AGAM|nr:hypothetical protein BS47DRAFT_848767 [Hydnum rufescens UP504]
MIQYLSREVGPGRHCTLKSGRRHDCHPSISFGRLGRDQNSRAVSEPTSPGARRVIFVANIAKIFITIPNAVYAVDTGKVGEGQYDPERYTYSFISHWTASSTLSP